MKSRNSSSVSSKFGRALSKGVLYMHSLAVGLKKLCTRESRARSKLNDAWLLRLPEHLTSDILLRLPIESISCCKCVCRTLEQILRDPHFADLHLNNASETAKRLIIQNKKNASSLLLFRVLDLDNISDSSPKSSYHHDCAPLLCRKVVIPPIISQSELVSVDVVGSCNGLLCLAYSVEKTRILYVCNPILGEFVPLPGPEPMPDPMVRAFGFCAKTKEYKVVRFGDHLERKANWISHRIYRHIHTLGTNGWRHIPNFKSPRDLTSPTHLNGNLHWLGLGVGLSTVLCSFNLETEQGFDIPCPPQLKEGHLEKRYKGFTVGVLGGLLCVSYILDGVRFEVFVMKNYGVKGCWTEQFAIDITFLSVLEDRSGEVTWARFMKKAKHTNIKFLDSGDLLLKYFDFPLIYNSRKKRFLKIMELDDKGRYACSFVGTYDGYYVPSLISLKQIVESENVQVVGQGVAATSSLTTKFIDLDLTIRFN